MKRHVIGKLAAALLLAFLTNPIATAAQELGLAKILNPMPDYDPFEKSNSAPPQFFPDDVDKRVRALLIDALTNNTDLLGSHLKSLAVEDSRLQKEYGTVTGLTEHAQDLLNNTIRDREPYLAAQREALRNTSSPARKKYLEAIINRDDLNQSEQLMRQSTTNFWGRLANRLLSSVDLVGIASGNFIGAAAETTVTQLYALMDHDMPVEARRALARHLDHLKRFPDDQQNGAITKEIETLDKKKKAVLARKQLDKASEALAKGDYERALLHAEVASFFNAGSDDAENIRQEAR